MRNKNIINLLKNIDKKLRKAIPLLTPMSVKDIDVQESQEILLKLCSIVEKNIWSSNKN